MDEELKSLLTGTMAPTNPSLPVGKNKGESFISPLKLALKYTMYTDVKDSLLFGGIKLPKRSGPSGPVRQLYMGA